MIGYDEEDGLFGQFIYGGTTPGYEGELWKHYYQNRDYAVSTYGRVWSCRNNIFLKADTDRGGHLRISMCYHGIHTHVFVHRMVAEMFIPNPDNLPLVRHLDGDPTNNVVWNLAWGTSKDNWEDAVRHGTARLVSDEDREKSRAMQRRPVIAISESDGRQICFSSLSDAARELQLPRANIWRCLNGRQSHTGGYSFIYAEEGGKNENVWNLLYLRQKEMRALQRRM